MESSNSADIIPINSHHTNPEYANIQRTDVFYASLQLRTEASPSTIGPHTEPLSYFDDTFDFGVPLRNAVVGSSYQEPLAPGCLCNPSNLRATEDVCKYHFESVRAAAPTLSLALGTFHRAITTCESFITCETCQRGTFTLACLVMSQQVLERLDALYRLLQQEQCCHEDSSHGLGFETVRIGGFEVPPQSKMFVVRAIVQAEAARGLRVIENLKDVVKFDIFDLPISASQGSVELCLHESNII